MHIKHRAMSLVPVESCFQ